MIFVIDPVKLYNIDNTRAKKTKEKGFSNMTYFWADDLSLFLKESEVLLPQLLSDSYKSSKFAKSAIVEFRQVKKLINRKILIFGNIKYSIEYI